MTTAAHHDGLQIASHLAARAILDSVTTPAATGMRNYKTGLGRIEVTAVFADGRVVTNWTFQPDGKAKRAATFTAAAQRIATHITNL